MSDLTHAVNFLQSAYTILLALALGEAFKQFVPDGDLPLHWRRLPALLSFLFLIFPFFHGMSRYFFVTYLHPSVQMSRFAGPLMADGIAFMLMSAFFFVTSRSLQPEKWRQFYGAMFCLIIVDSIWIIADFRTGVPAKIWLALNLIVLTVLLGVSLMKKFENDLIPPCVIAATTICTTVFSYLVLQDFYFP